jgi:hypothetical protein
MSLYMWEQYLGTGDRAFLKEAFPFMEATAQFLLAYQQVGSDGLLHAVANAHETQWAVQDPTTDIAADQTLFRSSRTPLASWVTSRRGTRCSRSSRPRSRRPRRTREAVARTRPARAARSGPPVNHSSSTKLTRHL